MLNPPQGGSGVSTFESWDRAVIIVVKEKAGCVLFEATTLYNHIF